MKILSVLTLSLLLPALVTGEENLPSPVGNESVLSQDYVPPGDPAVQRKLQWWQGLKFGLLMHWGTYSQWGIVESWSLCPEDEGWCRRTGPSGQDYFAYKSAYEGLVATFNPVTFNPEKWAAAAKDAGMRYLVLPPNTTTVSACSIPPRPTIRSPPRPVRFTQTGEPT